jgi:hypothetical protein
VEWSARIRDQIAADAHLLREKAFLGIEWWVEDADPRVLAELAKEGIKVVFYQR